MKSISNAYWNNPNTGATNESGFSALPGGYRNNVGSFGNGSAFFWSATEYDVSIAWFRGLVYHSDYVYRSNFLFGFSKSVGASVRCLKD